MVRTWPEELKEEGLAGATIVAGCTQHLVAMKGIAQGVFGRFAESI